ncbi:hypothetical protein ACTFIW_003015 [Dictyostelium discoideum]
MLKINIFIFLLFCIFLLFSGIQCNSNSDSNISSLVLIVDSNKINKNGKELCGNYLENSCNNIKDALNYYSTFVNNNNNSKNQNTTFSLHLKLVQGIYPLNENNLEFLGWDVHVSSYNSSQNVTIYGGNSTSTPFIKINSNSKNDKNTYLKFENIKFENFNGKFYSGITDSKESIIYIDFSNCIFSNSGKIESLYFFGNSTTNLENKKNKIHFYQCQFQHTIFKNNAFNFQNYFILIYETTMKSVTVKGSLHNEQLSESNWLSIFYSNFSDINFEGYDLIHIQSGFLSISFSKFDNINNTNNYLISSSNNQYPLEILGNNFTNINCNFINVNKGKVSLILNTISTDKSNFDLFNFNNSNIRFENTSICHPNGIGSGGSIVNCNNSTINYIGEILTFNSLCSTCDYFYNGNHSICKKDTSSGTTTSNGSTTGGGGGGGSTSEGKNSNSSNKLISIYFPILSIITIVLTYL